MQVSAAQDDFLKQEGRTQSATMVKDATLKYYISQLGNPNLVIYHLKLSCNGYMPVFTFKTLSRYLGSYYVQASASKIILLEKKTVVDIYGYAHAMQGSLAGSYLTYTGLALSVGQKDSSKLTDQGKRFLLRQASLEKVQCIEENTSKDKEEDIKAFLDSQ